MPVIVPAFFEGRRRCNRGTLWVRSLHGCYRTATVTPPWLATPPFFDIRPPNRTPVGQAIAFCGLSTRRAPYRTATVTPPWLAPPPTVNTTGTAPAHPTGTTPPTPTGTTTFPCIPPAICPGAPPAKRTSAVTPPMVTVTAATGCGSGAAARFPSTPPGEVCPSPAAYRDSTEPG